MEPIELKKKLPVFKTSKGAAAFATRLLGSDEVRGLASAGTELQAFADPKGGKWIPSFLVVLSDGGQAVGLFHTTRFGKGCRIVEQPFEAGAG